LRAGGRGAGDGGQVSEGAEIPRLDAAAQAAWAEVNWHWGGGREGRLTSDLPGRVADLRQEFKPETLKAMDEQNRRAKRADSIFEHSSPRRAPRKIGDRHPFPASFVITARISRELEPVPIFR
jgi:hypothetical protein